MPLRTLHRDSCVDLQALVKSEEETSNFDRLEEEKKNFLEINVETSESIDVNLPSSSSSEEEEEEEEDPMKKEGDEKDTETETLDDIEASMNQSAGDTKDPKDGKRSFNFPWFKRRPSQTESDLKKTNDSENGEKMISLTQAQAQAPMTQGNDAKKRGQNVLKRLLTRDATSEKPQNDEIPPKNQKKESNAHFLPKQERAPMTNDIHRRHLFPTTQNSTQTFSDMNAFSPTRQLLLNDHTTKSNSSESNKKRVKFATKASLISIFPHKDLPYFLKKEIWWQRADYRSFRRTIEILSENLVTNVLDDVWLLNIHDQNCFDTFTKKKDWESNEIGAKWWCHYGHSRRGLEHICSTEQGKHRQQNVAMSIACTLAEQDRQSNLGKTDDRKLSMAAFRYTSFARDLARAVGRADAEAVQVDFDTAKMNGFQFYMPSKYHKDGMMAWAEKEKQVQLLDLFTNQSRNLKNHQRSSLNSSEDENEPMSELDSFTEFTSIS